jgi:hypothetical protein
METIYHLIGMCPDAQSHIDIIDLCLIWDSFYLYLTKFPLSFIKSKFKL